MTNMAWTLFKFNEKLTSYVDKAETTLNSLYNYLNELKGITDRQLEDDITKYNFLYQMMKSIISSLCQIAPLPIIMYNEPSSRYFYVYELGVLQCGDTRCSVLLKYDVDNWKVKSLRHYEIIEECGEPIDSDTVDYIIKFIDFGDKINIEIPGIQKKIVISFADRISIELINNDS